MEKFICNINGTLVATSGIVHGLIAAVEGKKSDGKNNILPAHAFRAGYLWRHPPDERSEAKRESA